MRRVALPGLPWSREFMAAYEAAMDGVRPAAPTGASRTTPGTINAALVGYYCSGEFLALRAGTQRTWRSILERFRNEHGEKRISNVEPKHVAAMLAQRGHTPAAARNFLKALRCLMRFAISSGLIANDPTASVRALRYRSTRIHTWTEEEIALFEAKHPIGSRARLAFGLLLYTAQRKSDVVRMGRQHLRNGELHVIQQKTGTEIFIPVHRDLSVLLAAAHSNLTFLTTSKGAPFSSNGFGNWFRKKCVEAGLQAHCSSHGLRKAACRRLAETGCGAPTIMAISGHRTLAEVQRYIEEADRKRLAEIGLAEVAGAFQTTESRTEFAKPS
jgi:integrase